MSQTVIQRLAERIRSFGDKNVTKQAIELSRTAIIDTIGVTLAGSATRSHSSGVRPVPEDFLGQGAARGECSGNLVIQLVLWLTPIMLVIGGCGRPILLLALLQLSDRHT